MITPSSNTTPLRDATAAEGRTREAIERENAHRYSIEKTTRDLRADAAHQPPIYQEVMLKLAAELESRLTPAPASAPATAEVRGGNEVARVIKASINVQCRQHKGRLAVDSWLIETDTSIDTLRVAEDILARFPSLTAPASAASFKDGVEADGWRDMSSAPKSPAWSADILPDGNDQGVSVAYADGDGSMLFVIWWEEDDDGNAKFERWMPLPRALTTPAASQDSGGDEPLKAPECCPCIDETDCSNVSICRAVDDVYRKDAPETTDVRERARDALVNVGMPYTMAETVSYYIVEANLLRTPDIAATGGEPSDDEIAEWRRWSDAATPGPWWSYPDNYAVRIDGVDPNRRTICLTSTGSGKEKSNANFIAIARTAVPKLIDALTVERERREKAERERREEECDHSETIRTTSENAVALRERITRLTSDLAESGKEVARLREQMKLRDEIALLETGSKSWVKTLTRLREIEKDLPQTATADAKTEDE